MGAGKIFKTINLTKLILVQCALAVFCQDSEAQKPRPPKMRILLVDDRSKRTDEIDWKSKTRWVWAQKDSLPFETPTIEVSIDLPRDIKAVRRKGSRYRIRTKKKRQTLVLQTTKLESFHEVFIRGRRGKPEPITFKLKTQTKTHPFMVHPICTKAGVRAQRTIVPFRVSLSCDVDDEYLYLYILHPKRKNIRNKIKGPTNEFGTYWRLHRFKFPKRRSRRAIPVGFISVDNKKVGFSWRPRRVKPGSGQRRSSNRSILKNLKFSGGISTTLILYQQILGNITVDKSVLSLTPKIVATYLIQPGKFDVGANFFINAINIGLSQEAIETPAAMAGNIRAAYTVHNDRHLKVRVLGGYYLWGLISGNGTFGYDFLSGPTLSVFVQPKIKGMQIYGYFKYTMLTDSFENIDLANNREFAGGAGWEVTRLMRRYPLAVTLDISNLHMFPLNSSEFDFTSFSLGASVAF